MTGPDAAQLLPNASPPSEAIVFSDRIEILYRLGRHHLFLPFSALCILGVLYIQAIPLWVAVLPLLLQIAATVYTGQLAESYRHRNLNDGPGIWARRFTFASALS